jgi:hypothetical protein
VGNPTVAGSSAIAIEGVPNRRSVALAAVNPNRHQAMTVQPEAHTDCPLRAAPAQRIASTEQHGARSADLRYLSRTNSGAGFGGGPHCHVLVVDSAQEQFDLIRVFPSHTAHVHTGLVDGVFVADPDCDGIV